jgi:hypothetical protein
MVSALEIPAGTVIPVMMTSTVDSSKAKPGQVFAGKVMDDVPLPSGETIPAGAKVFGHVVQVSSAEGGSSSSLSLSFDRIVIKGHDVPIIANARALAAMMAVFESQVPLFEPDTAPPSAIMFAPVGGDAAFRPDNPEKSWGKLVKFSGDPAPGCGGRIDAEGGTGALWVFSPYACGVYGYGRSLAIAKDGRAAPLGQIELVSNKKFEVHAGSGWLLRLAPASLKNATPESAVAQ